MKNEIERKFLVKTLPNFTNIEKIEYERYFLFNKNDIEIRIQRKGTKFELERKVLVSKLERTREKLEITRDEFDTLKLLADDVIIRDGYRLSSNPDISVKIYHGKYEGLVRAEVESESLEELQQFQPPGWFGKEITDTLLARDSQLCKLSEEEFKKLYENTKI